MLFPA